MSWIIALEVFAPVRGLGTEEQGSLRLDFYYSLKIILTLGPIMGLFSGWTQIWMEDKMYRQVFIISFIGLRLMNTSLFLAFMLSTYKP